MNLTQLNNETKKQISKLKKPLSAYQYYNKIMREKWHSMTEEEKDKYLLMAKHDSERYLKEKQGIEKKLENEVCKLKLYLSRTTASVPCVGLDNGFTSYSISGPIVKVEMYTQEELEDLREKNIISWSDESPCTLKYKSVTDARGNTFKFNLKAAKKWSVQVYGGTMNNNNSWYSLIENYDGNVGHFTKYKNYKGETWIENY